MENIYEILIGHWVTNKNISVEDLMARTNLSRETIIAEIKGLVERGKKTGIKSVINYISWLEEQAAEQLNKIC